MNTKTISRALQQLAAEQGISVDEVRREITIALEVGRKILTNYSVTAPLDI